MYMLFFLFFINNFNIGVKWPAISLLVENKNNVAFAVGTALSIMNLG